MAKNKKPKLVLDESNRYPTETGAVLEVSAFRHIDGQVEIDTAVDPGQTARSLSVYLAYAMFQVCGNDWKKAYELGISTTAVCLTLRGFTAAPEKEKKPHGKSTRPR